MMTMKHTVKLKKEVKWQLWNIIFITFSIFKTHVYISKTPHTEDKESLDQCG